MKKKKLFGANIDPNCDYCSNNLCPEEEPCCSKNYSINQDGNCKYFAYDPLLRSPRSLPPLHSDYSAEDFAL